jgi:Uncharacterized MobA-related protein
MTIVVLAAGFSSRMEGKNKLLLPYHGKEMLLSAIEAALSTGFNVLVVTGHDRDRIKRILPHSVAEVYNSEYAQGQNTSIRAGIKAAEDDVLIAPGDLPKLKKEDYFSVAEELRHHPAVRLVHEGQPGHPVGIRKDLAQRILKEEITDVKSFLKANGLIQKEGSIDCLTDIDTPQAYSTLISER